MLTLAVMFDGHPMALRGSFMVLRGLGIDVFGHVALLSSRLAMPLNAAKSAIVPRQLLLEPAANYRV
jgi:hypothetical protein